MTRATARPMSERKYRQIPLDAIRVLNSRNRDRANFQDNIRSIGAVGLLKPILVNERPFEKSGYYELVCGEGRYLAFRELGHTHIPAEVIDCDRKQALLMSLVENIARVPPGTMWFAREVKRMHSSGFTLAQIAAIVGKSETYVRDYIRLVEQGEERLIKGVEQGLFSMAFAIRVARADEAAIQHILMDAFDSGIINSSNIPSVRRIIDLRMNRGKVPDRKDRPPRYTLTQLKADIARVTKEKESFVKESARKENRLLALLDGLGTLWKDDAFVALAAEHGLGEWPALKGTYGAAQPSA